MAQDLEWAVKKLREYLDASAAYKDAKRPGVLPAREHATLLRAATYRLAEALELAQQVLARTAPEHAQWLRKADTEDAALAAIARAIGYLSNRDELERRLGAPGPRLNAADLHPAVWSAASVLWRNGHYREAVQHAATSVNAQLQDKVGRRDISDAKLAREAFSSNPPAIGAPRLRFPDVEPETEDWTSRHEGVRDYAAGCFRAIRNHATHARPDESWEEQAALERLAALSLLGWWIDEAEVERAPGDPYDSPDAVIDRAVRVTVEDHFTGAGEPPPNNE